VTRSNGLTVLYDADCGVCSHTARMLVRADKRDRLRLVSIQSAEIPNMPPRGELMAMLHARDEDGHWFKGAAATVEIARRIPIAWPLTVYAKLPLAMPILDFMYRAFAGNRHAISRMLGLKACKVPERRALRPGR
jgi:predicted DCC family thiol-disulfide oxidoreductase YuxK